MKKIIFAVIYFGLSSTLAFSQKANNNDIKAKVEHLKSLLDLTDDQAKKLEQAETDYQNQLKKLSKNTNEKTLTQLKEKRSKKIQAILTREQFIKLDAVENGRIKQVPIQL